MSIKNKKYCFRLNVRTDKIKITFVVFNIESHSSCRYVSIHQVYKLAQQFVEKNHFSLQFMFISFLLVNYPGKIITMYILISVMTTLKSEMAALKPRLLLASKYYSIMHYHQNAFSHDCIILSNEILKVLWYNKTIKLHIIRKSAVLQVPQ